MTREQRRTTSFKKGGGRRAVLDPEDGAFVRIPGTAGAVRLRALPAVDDDPEVRADGGRVEDDDEDGRPLQETKDPSNYEFMSTPTGEKVHIVGVGMPPSFLELGRRATRSAPDDANKALCGTVTEFEEADDVPEDPGDDLTKWCLRCTGHAAAKGLHDRGKFEDRPL